jgi:hypothetical protein
MAEWRTRLTSPTYVSWREFDANRNGEIEPEELRALLSAVLPWPALHLDVHPAGDLSTHPGALERVLFLLREADPQAGSDDIPSASRASRAPGAT